MKRLSKKDLELHKGKGIPLNQGSDSSGKDAATQMPFCGATNGDNCETGQEKCHTELYTNCDCEGETNAETCNCYYTLFDDCPNTYRTCAESASHAELCCPQTQEGDQCVPWSRDTNCITPVTQQENCNKTQEGIACFSVNNCQESVDFCQVKTIGINGCQG